MGEDAPDLPVYRWDGYFLLPSACAMIFGCTEKGKCCGGAQRQSQFWGMARDGGSLGVIAGTALWKASPLGSSFNHFSIAWLFVTRHSAVQLQRSQQSQRRGFQSLWHLILNTQHLRRSHLTPWSLAADWSTEKPLYLNCRTQSAPLLFSPTKETGVLKGIQVPKHPSASEPILLQVANPLGCSVSQSLMSGKETTWQLLIVLPLSVFWKHSARLGVYFQSGLNNWRKKAAFFFDSLIPPGFALISSLKGIGLKPSVASWQTGLFLRARLAQDGTGCCTLCRWDF